MNAVRPLVSLIVRTKGDRPGLLDRALQSIMAQTYPNLEVIVERILKMHAFGQVLAA